MVYDVIVVGSGPAGISASLYTKRANLETLIISKGIGILDKVKEIENYYGLEKNITGEKLQKIGEKQAENLGIEIKNEEEVLILPFAKVKRIEHTSDWNGFSYYDMLLEKEELPELEMKDIEILKDKCLSNYEVHIENIEKYNLLHDEIEFLYMKDKRTIDREDKSAIYEKLRECWDKSSEYREKIDNYLHDFSKMLKASCRQKEIEIDNGDGTTTFYFSVNANSQYLSYRVSMNGKITKAGYVSGNIDVVYGENAEKWAVPFL